MAKKNKSDETAKYIFYLIIGAIPITILIGLISYNVPGGTYLAGVVPFPLDTFVVIIVLGIYGVLLAYLVNKAKEK